MKIIKILPILSFAFLFTLNINAQDRAKQDIGKIDRVSLMIKELDLNKEQAAKIKEITARFQSQRSKLGDNKEQSTVLRKSYKKQIETVLTPEQNLKFKKMNADKRAKLRKGQRGMQAQGKRRSADPLERMKEKLDLSEAQYARMQIIQNSYNMRIDAAKKSGNVEEVRSLRKEMHKNLTSMLTSEQKMKMEQAKTHRKSSKSDKRWDKQKQKSQEK